MLYDNKNHISCIDLKSYSYRFKIKRLFSLAASDIKQMPLQFGIRWRFPFFGNGIIRLMSIDSVRSIQNVYKREYNNYFRNKYLYNKFLKKKSIINTMIIYSKILSFKFFLLINTLVFNTCILIPNLKFEIIKTKLLRESN